MAEKLDPLEWVRIKDKNTKHESTVARMSVRPDVQEIIDKDAADANGIPLPAKPHRTPAQAKAAQATTSEETV